MGKQWVTLTELSKITGKAKSTLSGHVKKGTISNDCIKVEKGSNGKSYKRYDVKRVLERLSKYIDSSYNPGGKTYSEIKLENMPELYDSDSDIDAGDIDAEKLRKMKNQNELMEMEIRKRKGETLVASEVEEKQGEMAIAVKTNIMAMCDRIAPALVGANDIAEVSRLLRSEAKDALAAISKWILSDEKICESCRKKIVG